MILNNVNQKTVIDFKWIKIIHQKKTDRKDMIDRSKYLNTNQAFLSVSWHINETMNMNKFAVTMQ